VLFAGTRAVGLAEVGHSIGWPVDICSVLPAAVESSLSTALRVTHNSASDYGTNWTNGLLSTNPQ